MSETEAFDALEDAISDAVAIRDEYASVNASISKRAEGTSLSLLRLWRYLKKPADEDYNRLRYTFMCTACKNPHPEVLTKTDFETGVNDRFYRAELEEMGVHDPESAYARIEEEAHDLIDLRNQYFELNQQAYDKLDGLVTDVLGAWLALKKPTDEEMRESGFLLHHAGCHREHLLGGGANEGK